MHTSKILYATDFSPGSVGVLQYATWLARQTGSVLLIVHVSDAEPYPVGELFDEEPNADPEAKAHLESVVPEDSGVICEHHLLFGKAGSSARTKPSEVILDFAKREHVSMVVVGSHGRSGLRHLMMGSVAEAVMRGSVCPVVTVHLTETAS